MKKIFLCCAAGMSTSMVVNKMKQAAAQKGLETEIIAVAMEEFDNTLPKYDVTVHRDCVDNNNSCGIG